MAPQCHQQKFSKALKSSYRIIWGLTGLQLVPEVKHCLASLMEHYTPFLSDSSSAPSWTGCFTEMRSVLRERNMNTLQWKWGEKCQLAPLLVSSSHFWMMLLFDVLPCVERSWGFTAAVAWIQHLSECFLHTAWAGGRSAPTSAPPQKKTSRSYFRNPFNT